MSTEPSVNSILDLIQQDKFDEAQSLIESSFVNHNSNPLALNTLGKLNLKQGFIAEAIRNLANAARLEPQNVAYKLDLGKILFKRKKFEKARNIFNDVFEIDNDNAEAHGFINRIETVLRSRNQKRNHVVVTGTGRAGTTFLVHLLTKLNLDTGFDPQTVNKSIDSNARAGLEQNILTDPNCSYIVKSPLICDQIEEIYEKKIIGIDHAFIPIRDIESAAKSRIKVYEDSGNKEFIPGGIWQTSDPNQQEKILTDKLFNLLIGLSKMNTPVTLLNYPKLTKDPEYLFNKLKPILKNTSLEEFTETFNNTVNRKLVHKLTENDK